MKRLALSCLAVTTALGLSAITWPEKPVPSTSQQVAVLSDRDINESSGLCLSGRDPSLFWTLNDSGGDPCIFAIDQRGQTRARVRLRDAANFDWEDIAQGTDASGAPVLFVADIGDNFHIRPSLQVYEIPEPDIPPANQPVQETESLKPKLWRFNYPDGRHNAESLFVHPQSGRLFVITKSDDGKCSLYGFPQPLQANVSMTLEKLADLAIPQLIRAGKRPHDNCMTTAACIAPDGAHLLVATYSSLYEWQLPVGLPIQQAFQQAPIRIEPALTAQLEGACYALDSKTIWYTSERLPAPLVRITRP